MVQVASSNQAISTIVSRPADDHDSAAALPVVPERVLLGNRCCDAEPCELHELMGEDVLHFQR